MGQLGFFNADKRLEAWSARGDPLEAINHLVPWESFRAEIEAVVLTPDELKKSRPEAVRCHPDVQDAGSAGPQQSVGRAGGISSARPAVVLALSGLAIEDSIPDATTLWLFREKLAKAGLIEKRSTASTSILQPRATWRVAGRSSTPVSCRYRRSGTVVTRTPSCRLGAHRQGGSRSPPSCGRSLP
jgi:hypothetical protein